MIGATTEWIDVFTPMPTASAANQTAKHVSLQQDVELRRESPVQAVRQGINWLGHTRSLTQWQAIAKSKRLPQANNGIWHAPMSPAKNSLGLTE